MAKWMRIGLATMVVGAGPVLAQGVAGAAVRPSVSFRIAATVTAGTDVPVAYSAKHLPSGATFLLQRKSKISAPVNPFAAAPAPAWATVLSGSLRSSGAGTLQVPNVKQGSWTLRLEVLTRSGRVVATASTAVVSYANVSLAAVCAGVTSGTNTGTCNGPGSTSTVQIGGTIFTYAIGDPGAQASPAYDTELQSTKSSCRSADLTVAVASEDGGSGETGAASIVQSGGAPVSTTVGAGGSGTLSAPLSGGPWYLDLSGSLGPNTNNAADVYVNGTLSCFTANGEA